MASALSCLKKFRSFLLLFLTPLLLLPLMVLSKSKPADCAYVILLMAVYWCTEVIPLAVTSLLPALLFPLLKVLDSKQVCVQYMKDTTMLFLGGLIVAVAVEHWNVHKRIALRTLLLVGISPGLLMLGFMCITAFLSMWISNTATTAMMVPIVQAVLDQLKVTGKDNTFYPSSIELLDKDDQELQGEPWPCEPSSCLGLAPLASVKSVVPQAKSREAIAKDKNTCKALTLCVCYAASIGGTGTLTGTGPNIVLSGQMSTLFPESKDIVNFASWFGFAFPNVILMLIFSWIWLQCVFLGTNLKRNVGIGVEKTEKEKAAYLMLKEEYQKLGPLSYAEISVLVSFLLLIFLWFFRDPGFIPGWQSFYWMENKKKYVSDGTVAVFVSILMFILPSQKFKFNFRSQTEEEWKASFYPPPLLTWKVAQEKVPWGIVLLLGGGFALAKGCEVSGLSEWMGKQMEPLKSFSPPVLVLFLTILVACITEYTSNIATATLFLPIFASMSQKIKINPLYVMLPCTLSSSFAFMLPVATPPNAIVFSYGHLKVSDMVKTGLIMNIIGLICVSLAINTWGRFLFDLDKFPSWANATEINISD
ncbi:solute carrier family 13 member 5 [Trichosurus vulpecula]|uniref:solute carrier family 13 member 5 n=1 Tax=Trichosurus vulpecula TaxID=9337 RepID=UPI00186AFE9A|nr:solute carrier family 13 member 5 [Trichosurus vulpecula]